MTVMNNQLIALQLRMEALKAEHLRGSLHNAAVVSSGSDYDLSDEVAELESLEEQMRQIADAAVTLTGADDPTLS